MSGKRGKKGDGALRPIIIKRSEVVEGGHHGGAWKVAYADFVTAMMAFFLLMWLLNATTEAQRRGIADYFSPISPLSKGASGSGKPFGGKTPWDDGAMVSDRGTVAVQQAVSPPVTDPDEDPPDHVQPQRTADAGQGAGAEDSDNPGRGPTGVAQAGQSQAGQAQAGQSQAGQAQAGQAQSGQAQAGAQQAGQAQAGQSGQALVMQAVAQQGTLQAVAQAGQAAQGLEKAGLTPEEAAAMAAPRTPEQEQTAFRRAAQQIRDAVGKDPELSDIAKQLAIDVTPEGLRIQLLDEEKRSMFQLGSSVLSDRARTLLQKVAPALARLSEDIAITGHTDAAPFPGVERTNWELSTERANATRRLLAESGLPDQRFRSVTGDADRDPLLPSDPLAAANRRMAIVLLRRMPMTTPTTRPSEPLTPQGAAAAARSFTPPTAAAPAVPPVPSPAARPAALPLPPPVAAPPAAAAPCAPTAPGAAPDARAAR